MRTVSAADANRHFSAMLKEVSRGTRITVVSRGKPVAAIVPVTEAQHERRQARAALMKRLGSQAASGKRTWTREELYER
jgi:prevent-host-death family protein